MAHVYCKLCKGEIMHDGKVWFHVDGTPRHIATPDEAVKSDQSEALSATPGYVTYEDIRTLGELRRFLNKLPLNVDDKSITLDGSALGTVYFSANGLEFISA